MIFFILFNGILLNVSLPLNSFDSNITSIHDSCYVSGSTSARKDDLGILVTEMKRERPKSRPTVDDVKARVCRI